MLADARLQTLVLTSDVERARLFYSGALDLPLVGQSMGALVYSVGGGELRVSPVPSTQPTEHTIFGFAVENLDLILPALISKGVSFERHPGLPHDDRGVLTTPDGSRVIWFRDPDGNLISVVQYGGAPIA